MQNGWIKHFFCLSFIAVSISCVQQPELAQEQLTANFSHEGLTESCQVCHEKNRPTRDHVQSSDCNRCHQSTETWINNIAYQHPRDQKSCMECHSWDRPAAPHNQDQDCLSCHRTSHWNEELHYAHNPMPKSCVECHGSERPKNTVMPPPHNNTIDGHFEGKDCLECHRPEQEKGRPEAEIMPGRANDYHSGKRFKNSVDAYDKSYGDWRQAFGGKKPSDDSEGEVEIENGWKFDHSNAKNQDINYCLPCHLTAGKKQHWYEPWIFKGQGKCYKCHTVRHSWEH